MADIESSAEKIAAVGDAKVHLGVNGAVSWNVTFCWVAARFIALIMQ